MAKIYDISAKITNEAPVLRITDEIICTVNNRKQTMLNVRAYASEVERKQKELETEGREEEAESLQNEFINMALKMLVGEKNATAIEELDLPLPEYQAVYHAVMAVASGKDPLEEDTPSGKS